MKNVFRNLVCAVAIATLIIGGATQNVQAASHVIKSATHKYYCRLHSGNSTDMYVTFSAEFDNARALNAWFSDSYTHWPNGVQFDSTGCGYGYARGTYTIYSSLITEWVSLAFQSTTSTIYLYA